VDAHPRIFQQTPAVTPDYATASKTKAQRLTAPPCPQRSDQTVASRAVRRPLISLAMRASSGDVLSRRHAAIERPLPRAGNSILRRRRRNISDGAVPCPSGLCDGRSLSAQGRPGRSPRESSHGTPFAPSTICAMPESAATPATGQFGQIASGFCSPSHRLEKDFRKTLSKSQLALKISSPAGTYSSRRTE